MTGEVLIGQTAIPYTVRGSSRARRQRLIVRPSGVELVVPPGTAPEDIDRFLNSRRPWLYEAVRTVGALQLPETRVWATGAKVELHGRRWTLEVVPGGDLEVHLGRRLRVIVPRELDPEARAETVAAAVGRWLKGRAEADLCAHAATYLDRLPAAPRALKLTASAEFWGRCEADGTVRVHWHLVHAPPAAMAYVVAHELVHLEHRHHGEAFWRRLAEIQPDYQRRKAMLERWERERVGGRRGV